MAGRKHDRCKPCRDALKAKKRSSKRQRQTPKRLTPIIAPLVPNPYSVRNEILKNMGYETYSDYLDSKRWKRIRAEVLDRNPNCVRCGDTATQVHHSQYTNANLVGNSIEHLHPVCRPCHEFAEIGRHSRKLSLQQANERLGITKPTLDLRKNKPRKYGPPKLAAKKRPITNEPETGRSRETGSAPDLQLS